jgi:hypothetical protein
MHIVAYCSHTTQSRQVTTTNIMASRASIPKQIKRTSISIRKVTTLIASPKDMNQKFAYARTRTCPCLFVRLPTMNRQKSSTNNALTWLYVLCVCMQAVLQLHTGKEESAELQSAGRAPSGQNLELGVLEYGLDDAQVGCVYVCMYVSYVLCVCCVCMCVCVCLCVCIYIYIYIYIYIHTYIHTYTYIQFITLMRVCMLHVYIVCMYVLHIFKYVHTIEV